jgi:hypothetical protein
MEPRRETRRLRVSQQHRERFTEDGFKGGKMEVRVCVAAKQKGGGCLDAVVPRLFCDISAREVRHLSDWWRSRQTIIDHLKSKIENQVKFKLKLNEQRSFFA